jgi:catechol 2,3-dioxygenase-like lactoylglutathione lyase family enzyme
MDWKLEVVVLPVTDVDRSKKFYEEQCGFNVDVDRDVGMFRVVQLTPPGSGCSVTVGPVVLDEPPATPSRLQLVVPDIDAARAELVGRGVDAGPVVHFDETGQVEGHGGDWNSFVFFEDPDGHNWAIQQAPTAA